MQRISLRMENTGKGSKHKKTKAKRLLYTPERGNIYARYIMIYIRPLYIYQIFSQFGFILLKERFDNFSNKVS